MVEKLPSKVDALRAMREARHSANSSDGGVESRHAISGTGPALRQSRQPETSLAGVAPGPSEANPKKKRAPRGTFDRIAYQREYMRKKRAAKDET